MRLGWRHPRPNDYQGPDSRPLRDTFISIQQLMTWPHYTATIDASQAVGVGFSQKTITAGDDPFQLIRSNDTIQVPRDSDTWLFIGNVNVSLDNVGAGVYQVGYLLNGSILTDLIGESYRADANDPRVFWTGIYPVKKGDFLSVAAQATPGGSAVNVGHASGYFLPMT